MATMSEHNRFRGESGFASIIVVITFAIILSLIAMGMARIANRESRQALDRQLSAQAYYAAETGVNTAINMLRANPNLAATNDCALAAKVNSADTDTNASFTCLLIDPAPTSQEYENIETTASKVTQIGPFSGTYIPDRILFNWQGKTFRSDTANPTASGWGADTGILRVSIYPIHASNSPATLLAQSRTYFLYPTSSGGGTIAYNAASARPNGDGSKVSANCATTASAVPTGFTGANLYKSGCTALITGLSLPVFGTGDSFVIRLSSIYQNVTMRFFMSDGTNLLNIPGGQAMIDSTGKGADVFKRLRVFVPINAARDAAVYPEDAIQSAFSICKRFRVPADGTAASLDSGVTNADCGF